jgi:serine/threonine-protein kinase
MAARRTGAGRATLMDWSRWPQADALLDEALTLAPDERDAFITRIAQQDGELAAALQAALAEAVATDGFLEPGAALMLQPGTRIEQYEVIGLIGRGGMGEVYRARDTRLQREVALKVLPALFAHDDHRLARFRREARVLALLSHPGIGAIYGLAEADGLEALVLEFVEGPTLADVLQRGPLPLDQALAIARHLVEAVAAAHARGILHRDLKPANVKVLGDGTIKVLDFGLAKAFALDHAAVSTDLTGAAPALLLGTAAYMSPEQVRGASVDARMDIWAFGCILFEMLTGARAFTGDSVAEILARVIEREPAFGLLPDATPPSIRRLLRRALDKDVTKRLGYIADALLDLDDAAAEPALEAAPPARSRAAIALATLVALVAGVAVGSLWRRAAPPPEAVSRFMLPLAAGLVPVTGFQPMVAVAPDGRTIVFRARQDGVTRLYRRALDDLEARAIPGTDNATGPFFSPDGRWLGFDSDGVLKRVSLAGGLPVVIAPAPGGVTATWAADDSIVYATNTTRVLHRVSASGGEAEAITTLDTARGETLHALPQAVGGRGTILFTIVAGSDRRIATVDLATREIRVIGEGTHARFLPPDLLLFSRQGTLWGMAVDDATLVADRPAVPMIEGIEHTDDTVLHFAVSDTGSLVYLPAGQMTPGLQRLVWIDREGHQTPAGIEPRAVTRISLSPDGTRVAMAISERGNADIWIADLRRQTMSRLTSDPTIETMPAWSPDGRYVAFRSEREGPGVFRRDADGAAPVERLSVTDGPIHSPYSWTPDGRTLLVALFRSFNRQGIARVTPPDTTARMLLDGEFAQLDPHISPNGRWMAYQSDETGQFEIYVRPYPNVQAGRTQISTSGGTSPRWSADGRELFFYSGGALMRAPVSADGEFSHGSVTRLFTMAAFGGRLGPGYEVARDGRRFLFIVDGESAATAGTHLVYVEHWAGELRARLSEQRPAAR